MGNRIYGCDDCLAACPWNKFAQRTKEHAFLPRAELTAPRLADLAALDDATFSTVFSGSPIKRIGRDRFVRNVLIAIGNCGDAGVLPAARAAAGRCLAPGAGHGGLGLPAASRRLPRTTRSAPATRRASGTLTCWPNGGGRPTGLPHGRNDGAPAALLLRLRLLRAGARARCSGLPAGRSPAPAAPTRDAAPSPTRAWTRCPSRARRRSPMPGACSPARPISSSPSRRTPRATPRSTATARTSRRCPRLVNGSAISPPPGSTATPGAPGWTRVPCRRRAANAASAGSRRRGAGARWARRTASPSTSSASPGSTGRGATRLPRRDAARRSASHAPGQVFSRIHVADIAQVLAASIARPRAGAIYNLCDDEPAPAADVVAHACALLGVAPPPPLALGGGRALADGAELLRRQPARLQRPHQGRARREAALSRLPAPASPPCSRTSQPAPSRWRRVRGRPRASRRRRC